MTDTISNLSSLVSELVDLRTRITGLNNELKELKSREDDLKRSILLEMGGAKSIHLEGVGRIVRKEKVHYEIRNQEALAVAILRRMIEQGQKGQPLSEALLLQQRVSSRLLEDTMDAMGLDESQQEVYLAEAGLVRVSEPALSLTK